MNLLFEEYENLGQFSNENYSLKKEMEHNYKIIMRETNENF